MRLIHGECLMEMDKLIEEGVKVDAIITDPPYGTTACKWDSVIPFDDMWERLHKLIKPNGAIVLFGSEPFASALRMSNIKNYKYDWVWDKINGLGFYDCNIRPIKIHENICVFSESGCSNGAKVKMRYIPQGLLDCEIKENRSRPKEGSVINYSKKPSYIRKKTNYPKTIITFSKGKAVYHPTQKPTALMEYLIKTYTNEGETVLDFTIGSGTTGVACKNTSREFIGIEMDDKYFEVAKKRINEA